MNDMTPPGELNRADRRRLEKERRKAANRERIKPGSDERMIVVTHRLRGGVDEYTAVIHLPEHVPADLAQMIREDCDNDPQVDAFSVYETRVVRSLYSEHGKGRALPQKMDDAESE